ncbi:pore-forming ESAT-6 family protein [Microbacterium marinum]|uniref:pore-forming ESAT-6 family protein n=1 Tax=Microbacterium marinum TaxID=421115 RepID=UPI00384C1569
MPTADDRRAYDVSSSQEVQEEFNRIAGLLETLISTRDTQVKAAMADYQADGVSDEYQAKEVRWNRAATEVRTIINLLRSTMETNDGTAATAGQRARTAVENIG